MGTENKLQETDWKLFQRWLFLLLFYFCEMLNEMEPDILEYVPHAVTLMIGRVFSWLLSVY